MTTYKNIHGKRVKTFATDLDNAEAEGQIFFSEAAIGREFKTVVASAAWAASGPMLTARGLAGSGGTSTSAFVAAGYTTTIVANTEEYNGTGFSSGGNVNTGRSQTAGAGTETAGLIAGGFEPPSTGKTEEYNGSSWSEQNDMNVERRTMSGTAGTQTAALYFGGYRDITPTPNGAMNSTESYNGTSWTNEPALNTAVWQNTGSGIQTAAVSVGGPPTQTEHYDGSSWTTNAAINTAKLAAGAAGTTSNIVVYGGTTDGGDTGLTGTTELYDGTSWTEVADLAVARRGLGKAGAYNNAIAMGGLGPAKSNTEEFNITANTVTAAAWASGGSMNTGRYLLAGCGASESALLGAGGYGPAAPANNTFKIVEEYNGTSWSEVNDLPAIKSRFRGVGTQTAAATFGGFTPLGPNTTYNTTEKYDGTNWTTSGNMNTARCYMAGFGTQTAAVSAGGATLNPDVGFNKTEEYNGTAWSEVNNMPNFFRNQAGVGIISAGVTTGGKEGPSSSYPGIANTTTTLEYDGTNWTAGGTSLVSNGNSSGGGTQSVAWFAGYPGNNGNFHYNGTSFVTSVATSTTHSSAAGGAPQTSGVIFGGYTGTAITATTEEFTGETTSLNLKTITDS